MGPAGRMAQVLGERGPGWSLRCLVPRLEPAVGRVVQDASRQQRRLHGHGPEHGQLPDLHHGRATGLAPRRLPRRSALLQRLHERELDQVPDQYGERSADDHQHDPDHDCDGRAPRCSAPRAPAGDLRYRYRTGSHPGRGLQYWWRGRGVLRHHRLELRRYLPQRGRRHRAERRR